MSKTIDERVVEMRFDNKQFESNVQTSMRTIEKLKKSLDMDGATKGLENIDRAAKKIDMSGLGNTVDTVRLKFSAMEVVAITALTNITNSAINTGKELIASLSVDQITAGFNKYADKTKAVQTIMSATGLTIEEVEEQLTKLNWFTDETSYNFTDMANNIGKFTSQGIDLTTATSAMQGIATWAAKSGQGTNEASRAMYNLSQALGVGAVKVQDWMSIENANMATAEFKQLAIDTAKELGILNDTSNVTVENFRSTLSDGWFTSDVLIKVLNQYGEFSDRLYAVSEQTGLSASELLSHIKEYQNGTLDMNEIINETGMSADELSQIFSELSSETMQLGNSSFRAAQEAKTFSDAIEATKDAVSTGWMNTFDIIFGNYEEAKELWTDLANAMYNVFAAGAEDRNAMLREWKELGGRTVLVEAFWAAWENVGDILGTVKEAFREVFPPMTAEKLYSITKGLKTFVEKLKLSDTTLANLKSTFKGLFAILDIVKQAFSAIFTAIKPLLGGFGSLGEGVLGFTGGLGNAIVKFDEFIKSSGAFQKVGEGIAKVLEIIITVLRTLKDKIKEKLESASFEGLHNLLERIQTRMSQLGEVAEKIKSGIITAIEAISNALANCQFLKLLESIWNAITRIASGIVKTLGKIGSSLAKNLGKANFSGIIDLLNGISFGAIALGITKFMKSISEPIKELSGMLDSVKKILDGVRGCFEAYQKNLQAGTLLKIASAVAILTASIIAISLIDSDKLTASLAAITVLFTDLMIAMNVFDKISGNIKGTIKSVTAMIGMATAVLILASALKKIGNLNIKQLGTGLLGVAGLTAIVVAAAKAMSTNSKTVIKGATRMLIFAAAIKILASVCEQLSKLDWNQLAKGLVGVGVLLGEVSLFLRTAKFGKKAITTATGIIILSAAIKVLASACKDFGEMKWGDIGKGLISIGSLFVELAAFTKLTGNASHVISTGIALIAIAAAMKILASAVADFSVMQWGEIARGLIAMAGALTVITVAVNFMPKNLTGIGIGLITVSTALLIIANVLEKMSGFSWEGITKGLSTLGGSMAILAIGLNAMKGTLAGSAALLAAVSALLALTPVLVILGAMSWTAIVKGLVTLAGAFTVLGVAGTVLAPLAPSILALSGSLALIGLAVVGIGAGLALAGAGLSAMAVGLTALAAAGTAGATAIVAALTIIITGIAGLIPAIVAKLGEAIVEFCKVIANSAGAIGEAVKALVLMLVDVLVECVPVIADGVLQLVVGVLDALVQYAPTIVDSIFQFLIEVLEGVARNLPALIQAAVDVLMAFFSGVVDALKSIDTETLLQGIVGIGLLAAIMAALSAVAALVPGAMLGVLGMGVVIAELALVLAAVGALAQIPGLDWLINEGGNLLQSIGTAIGKFIGGIVGGFMSGVSSQFPQIGSDLSGFMTNVQPFLDGAASINPSMLDGVKALAETILILTAANLLDGLTAWFTGGSSLSSFAEELAPFGRAMKQFSDEISGIDGEAVSNAAIAGKTLAEMADTLPNSGGVIGFFAGENDMEEFGNQLVPFAKAMKAFANEVAGLDTAVIQEAATAGKAMAEMATTIPNSGGVVGFFAGENDMDDFGEQLVPFGKAMKEYANAVSGLDADVVQNSVVAGKALLELANTVPNTGGVVAWFTGDNDLKTFGEQLVPFGTAMKNYSLSVAGIDSGVVVNSANAAKALVELANNLPNTGGIVSWFTGDNDVASFGESLASFGESFMKYYNSISSVDVAKLSGVVGEFRNLVDLANGIKSVDTSGMSTFAKNLTALGNTGIDGFIDAFTNANSRVSTAADTMVTTFINAANAQKSNLTNTSASMVDAIITALTSKYSQFTTIGSTMMTKFVSAVKSSDSSARTAFANIVSGCLTTIRNKFYEFQTVGQMTMTKLIAGIKEKNQLAKEAFVSIINTCLTTIRDKYTDFYNTGVYLVKGFALGIDEYTWYAEAKARAMAKAAARAAEAELDINSPSKVGYRIGGFFGLGFVNSLIDYADKSYDAGTSIAASAKEGLRNTVSKISDFIEDGIDSQPMIRPILDLSQVQTGVGKLSALLSRSQAMSIDADMERQSIATVQNGETAPATSNSFNFTQNNYSPKALSRIELYRQTKNQFSALEGLVTS